MLILTIPAATASASIRSDTPEEPCSTKGIGSAAANALIRARSTAVVGSTIACEQPTATASASTSVVGDELGGLGRVGAYARRVGTVLAADLAELRLEQQAPVVSHCAAARVAATFAS